MKEIKMEQNSENAIQIGEISGGENTFIFQNEIDSTLDDNFNRNDCFALSQERYNAMRSNRFRYIEIDESLFANALPKRFDIVFKDTNQKHRTLLDIVVEDKSNLIFVGEGGTGKTTSLLQIWEEWLAKKFDLPMYVPLNEYDGNADNFILIYVKKWYSLNLEKTNISVILLLDGFNEINGNPDKIISEIKEISARRNIRIILTSRHSLIKLYGLDSFMTCNIQPLNSEVIHNFLVKCDFPFMDGWEELLSTPMMLTLYVNTCAVRRSAEEYGLFKFKPSQSKGELIYNYLLCQLVKLSTLEQKENIYSAYIALFGIAPYIAWRIETQGKYSLSIKDCKCFITEYLSLFGTFIQKKATDFLEELAFRINFDMKDDKKPLDILIFSFYVLAEEQTDSGNRYSFHHQHFRDFFSAMHIDNSINKAVFYQNQNEFITPDEIKARVLPPYIIEMLGGYYGEYRNSKKFRFKTSLHELLDSLRDKNYSETVYAVNNVIGIWKYSRSNHIIGEDLTRLDFSHTPLSGIVFSNYDGASIFDKSIISNMTFVSNGHLDTAIYAVYSEDGKNVLSFSPGFDSNIALVWDRETATCLQTFICLQNFIRFSKNQTYVSENGNEKLCATEYGYCILEKNKLQKFIVPEIVGITTKCAKSKDGKRILGFDKFNEIIIETDKHTGKQHSIGAHFTSVQSAVYSDDEQRVLSTSSDKTIKEWHRQSGKCLRTFYGHSGFVWSAVYSDDGRYVLSTSDDKTIREWDRETGECIRIFEMNTNVVTSITYSADDKIILFANTDYTLKEWCMETNTYLQSYVGHIDVVNTVFYSPNKQKILSASEDGTFREWDRKTGKCLNVFIPKLPTNDYYKTPTDKEDEWEVQMDECLNKTRHTAIGVKVAIYSTNGERILSYSTGDGYLAREWDIENCKDCLHIINIDGYNDDKSRAYKVLNDGRVILEDANTGENVYEYCFDYTCKRAGKHYLSTPDIYSEDGQRVLSLEPPDVSSENEECVHYKHINYIEEAEKVQNMFLSEWDTKTGEQLCRYIHNGHITTVIIALYSTDEEKVLTVTKDGFIREWNRKTGECLLTIPSVGGAIINGCSFEDCIFQSNEVKQLILSLRANKK